MLQDLLTKAKEVNEQERARPKLQIPRQQEEPEFPGDSGDPGGELGIGAPPNQLSVGLGGGIKNFSNGRGQSQSNREHFSVAGLLGQVTNNPIGGARLGGRNNSNANRGPGGKFLPKMGGDGGNPRSRTPNHKDENPKPKKSKIPQVNQNGSRVARVLQITGVDELPLEVSKNRRFRIQFAFADRDGRRHTATVRFGQRKQDDFIDTGATTTQIKRLSRLISHEKTKDPLQPHHWNVWLLNSHKSIPEAVNAYRQHHNIL